MEKSAKNYEIAYLLNVSMPENDISAWVGALTGTIEDAKGMIRRVEEPKKRQLAYPINKQTTAYFGWTAFSIAPSAVATIQKKIKTDTVILRHLIVEETAAVELMPKLHLTQTHATRPDQPILRSAEDKDQKLDFEALDKKLEEILGK